MKCHRVYFLPAGLILLTMVTLTNCSESVDAIEESEPKIETYELSGIEIHYKVAWAAPPDTFSIDTIEVQYIVDVEWLETKQDTIRFYELPGAKLAYSAHGDLSLCSGHSPYCDLDAHYYNENTFEMYLLSPSGRYEASGIIEEDKLELEGNFFYRTVSIDYLLTGEKI